MIEIKDYSYPELCSVMNDKVKTGDSKTAQLNKWKLLFKWENPTKRIFRITEIYDIPKEKVEKRGGSRIGAGAKIKLQDEFDILFPAFLCNEQRKNKYFTHESPIIYFSNYTISKFFGVYKDLYSAETDDNVNIAIYRKIADKLREKTRSWILNKITKIDNVTLEYGIIAYKTKKDFDYRDDLLNEYNIAEQEFIELHKLKTLRDVVNTGLWDDMKTFINLKFNDYIEVKKLYKITYNTDEFPNPDRELIKQAMLKLNTTVIKEVYSFFLTKEKEKYVDDIIYGEEFDESKVMSDYTYIIKSYISLL